LIDSGADNGFVAKLSTTGLYLRVVKSLTMTNNDSQLYTLIGVDNLGNSYIAGTFYETINF
jgi:hypothetical protein